MSTEIIFCFFPPAKTPSNNRFRVKLPVKPTNRPQSFHIRFAPASFEFVRGFQARALFPAARMTAIRKLRPQDVVKLQEIVTGRKTP